MIRNHSHPIARCAEFLLAMIRRSPDHRLSQPEQQTRREEVNRLLDRMDDDVIVEALQKLYRIAERDARRRAQRLAAALTEPQHPRRFPALRRKTS